MASRSSRNLANNNILFYRRRRAGGNTIFSEVARSSGLAIDFAAPAALTVDSGMAITYNGRPDDLLTYTAPYPKLCLQSSGSYSYQAHNLWFFSDNFASNTASFSSGATVSGNVVSISTSTGFLFRTSGSSSVSGATYALTFKATSSITGTVTFSVINTAGSTTYRQTQVAMVAGVQQSLTITYTASDATAIAFGIDQRVGGSSNLSGGTVTFADVHSRRTPSPSTFLSTSGAARYNLPYEWNTSGTPFGIRVEPAATNLALNSFLTGGVTGTPGTAPTSWSGFTTGGSYTAATSGGLLDQGYLQVAVVSSGRQHFGQTVSVAANTRYLFWSEVNVVVASTLGNTIFITNEPAGATVSYALNGAAAASGDTLPTGRCVIAAIVDVAATSGTIGLRMGVGVQGNTTGTIQFFNAQCEIVGSGVRVGTSPIETFGSTVTRAADTISILTSAFPYGSGAIGTVAAVFTPFDLSNRPPLQIGSGNDRLLLFVQSGTTRNLIFNGGSAVVANLDHSGSLPTNTQARIATAWQTGSLASSLNGAAAITSSNAFSAFGSGNSLFIGSGEGNFMNGWLRQILFVPRRVSNADLPTFGA